MQSVYISCILCSRRELLVEFGTEGEGMSIALFRGWALNHLLGAQCPECKATKPTVRQLLNKKLEKTGMTEKLNGRVPQAWGCT